MLGHLVNRFEQQWAEVFLRGGKLFGIARYGKTAEQVERGGNAGFADQVGAMLAFEQQAVLQAGRFQSLGQIAFGLLEQVGEGQPQQAGHANRVRGLRCVQAIEQTQPHAGTMDLQGRISTEMPGFCRHTESGRFGQRTKVPLRDDVPLVR